ncbi:MAG TPA: terminase large subunit, partial [Gemmataceae bacterium]|nr:terminase large subunit [Gemmataceae bacterium]
MSGLRSRLARLSRALATRPKPSDSALERWRADPVALMRDAGFSPDPWQAEFLRSNDRMNLMLCARQVGKSLTVSILTLHAALTAPDQTVIVVAQRQDQASELLRKSKTAYYRAKPPVGVVREGATHFELANGSRILALPGEERAMHGPTANLLVIDEAARVPDEVFNAASPQ